MRCERPRPWDELSVGQLLAAYYEELAVEYRTLEEKETLTTSEMRRLTEIDRLLSPDDDRGTGPTGDKWIDDFMEAADDDG